MANRYRPRLILLVCLSFFNGCAVIEPTDQDRARVTSAVGDAPAVSVESLSISLGVSPLAVVKALPAEMARVWPGDPASAWDAVRGWGAARVESGASRDGLVFTGDPAEAYAIDPTTYTRMSRRRPIQIVIDWDGVSEVWLLRKPTAEGTLLAVWFFDGDGAAALRVSVPKDEGGALDAAVLDRFDAMWGDAGAE